MRPFVILSIAVSLWACQVSGELTGSFTCAETQRCPAGFACVGDVCVATDDGGMGAAPCGTTDQLSTTFDGATLPPWFDTDGNGNGKAEVKDGTLRLTVVPQAANSEIYVYSDDAYDLRGRSITVEVPMVAGDTTEIILEDPTDARVYMGVDEGSLFVYSKGRLLVERPYSAEQDRWWRARADGLDLVFETAPDGQTWSVFGRDAAPLNLAWVELAMHAVATSDADAGTALFASVNADATTTAGWCPLASWTDALDDGTLAPQLQGWDNGKCTVAEEGGKITMTATGRASYCEAYTSRPVDARDSAVAMEVSAAAAPMYTAIRLTDRSGANELYMEASDTLQFFVRANGMVALDGNAAIDLASQKFWRIVFEGAQVRFEASVDAATWQVLSATTAPALDASALRIYRTMGTDQDLALPVTSSFGAILR